MQARKIRYNVIGLTETRRHRPLIATFDTGEELFLGTCDSRGVGGVGVLVNTNLVINMDSSEQLKTQIGRLRLKRCGSTPALTIFKPTSLRWTWESPRGEDHNEIDHIIVNRRFCLADVGVVPKFYTGSDQELLRARFFFSRKG
ncbi:hypothetical protein ANCCAN_04675 [Ancylostoma caninum]|uniref:Uncharacterized protein n=1 Tax=Ancylostoma caninum TaxID=29170 RepID=A0A368H1X1_ANCCA|nr:hypothetical protein ANCCAN_04675 [Ancylostoma caninum]